MGIFIFGGGFLAYLVSEAYSGFAWYFFILLIPYAIMGYGKSFDALGKTIEGNKKADVLVSIKTGYKKVTILILLGVATIIMWSILNLMPITFQLNGDSEEWNQNTSVNRIIEERYFYLCPKESQLNVDFSKIDEGVLHVNSNSDMDNKILVTTDYSDKRWKYFFTCYLSQNKLGYSYDDNNWRMRYNNDEDNTWWVRRENRGYLIICSCNENKVLTYNEDTKSVSIEDYQAENINQIWELK